MMQVETRATLLRKLRSIDGRGYSSYKEVEGAYDFGPYTLVIDHVQPDPYAPPTRMLIKVQQDWCRISGELHATNERKVAMEDFLTRSLVTSIHDANKDWEREGASRKKGSSIGGTFSIDQPGQTVLMRSSVCVKDDSIDVRITLALPADGRTILGKAVERLLDGTLPVLLEKGLTAIDVEALQRHVVLFEDQCAARQILCKQNWAAFVGDGAILARVSGRSDLPLSEGIAFQSPDSMRVTMELPSGRTITGMAIHRGITVIVGGGFHGKSTLLQAIERGVYNHIEGDGREWCITADSAVKIRAEEGRRVSRVDISPFVSQLPFGKRTDPFSTEDASGSTSQAASLIEAMEVGCELLLIDEDTSATNFMIRDARMQALVNREQEPIIPLIDRIRPIADHFGVSTIMVVGGTGDYLDVADHVIRMDEYRPYDATEQARKVVDQYPSARQKIDTVDWDTLTPRVPLPVPIHNDRSGIRFSAKGLSSIQIGSEWISLSAVEQLVDASQTRAIADLIRYIAQRWVDGEHTLKQVIERALQEINRNGFGVIASQSTNFPGNYVLPRIYEVAAVINRIDWFRLK